MYLGLLKDLGSILILPSIGSVIMGKFFFLKFNFLFCKTGVIIAVILC